MNQVIEKVNMAELNSSNIGDMASELVRIGSFVEWPTWADKSAIALAVKGFYYSGGNDIVICFSCKGKLGGWKPSDDITARHKKLNPNCAFIPIEKTQNSIKAPTVKPSINKLDVMLSKPKHQSYASKINRINSFKTWPKKDIVPIEVLANAGFFYCGFADNVKCFFCDGGLRNWTTGDDPWAEHAKWFSKCGFLKLQKGDDVQLEDEPASGDTAEDVLSSKDPEVEKLVEQYTKIKEERTCKICMAALCIIIFLPCGHLVCCGECAVVLTNCPICRTKIKGSVRCES